MRVLFHRAVGSSQASDPAVTLIVSAGCCRPPVSAGLPQDSTGSCRSAGFNPSVVSCFILRCPFMFGFGLSFFCFGSSLVDEVRSVESFTCFRWRFLLALCAGGGLVWSQAARAAERTGVLAQKVFQPEYLSWSFHGALCAAARQHRHVSVPVPSLCRGFSLLILLHIWPLSSPAGRWGQRPALVRQSVLSLRSESSVLEPGTLFWRAPRCRWSLWQALKSGKDTVIRL